MGKGLRILITGGAGYKGVKLSKVLLDLGHQVTILDNFMFGYDSILGITPNPNCEIVQKDIRALEKDDVKAQDIVFHLAAISGYPACEANPHAAQNINVEASKLLVSLLSKAQVLIYASTTSIYGNAGTRTDEESAPQPVSLYAVTKFKAEQLIMQRENSVALRFATLFGVSPKMRNDLMLNDFVLRAVSESSLILFDSASKRTFLHVDDAIAAYAIVLERLDSTKGKILNVGDENYNFSKKELANKIGKHVKFDIIESILEDRDRRDFIVAFDKIRALGFQPKVSMDAGIAELVKLYSFYRPYSPYRVI